MTDLPSFLPTSSRIAPSQSTLHGEQTKVISLLHLRTVTSEDIKSSKFSSDAACAYVRRLLMLADEGACIFSFPVNQYKLFIAFTSEQ